MLYAYCKSILKNIEVHGLKQIVSNLTMEKNTLDLCFAINQSLVLKHKVMACIRDHDTVDDIVLTYVKADRTHQRKIFLFTETSLAAINGKIAFINNRLTDDYINLLGSDQLWQYLIK